MNRILDYLPRTRALLEQAKEPTYKEKIIQKIRTKYSVDDELAILRQRESKPEEFKEYFDFVENIKQNLKDNEITDEDAEEIQEVGDTNGK
jgi:hypothetical protein